MRKPAAKIRKRRRKMNWNEAQTFEEDPSLRPGGQQVRATGGDSIYDALAQWYFNNVDPVGRSQQHGRLNTAGGPDVGMAPQQNPQQLSQAALQAALKGFTG
jgi:hypothetical protein